MQTLGTLEPGAAVGRSRLLRELGRGATGVVFQATDADERVVALKVLSPPALLSAEERGSLRSRFQREARALATVHHPNVVSVYDCSESDGWIYLAMEFVDGENLRQLLAREGALPPARASDLAVQLCSALEAVHHAGIIHRDVKPENLILLPDGTLKLTDFGIAWMRNEATLTRTGGILGSPAYMSPEQILGRPVDQRSDLFSAAVTLYQLLADRLPFEGASLMELAHKVAYSEPAALPSHVPYSLARAVLRGLQKSPGARPLNANEMAEAVRSAAAQAASARPARRPLFGVSTLLDSPSAGGATAVSSCAKHPRRDAFARCRACARPLCRQCARGRSAPYFCQMHAPVTFFGIPTVRFEIVLVLLTFFLLLAVLSPFGYAMLRH